MKSRIVLTALVILAWVASAQAQTAIDPCAQTVPKSFAAVNIASATTAELVAAVAGKTVYVCGFFASMQGTTPSIQFKSGTKVTNPCDTSPVTLTGIFLPTAGTDLSLGYGGTLFASSSGGEICATAGGTTPSIQGFISYVQL